MNLLDVYNVTTNVLKVIRNKMFLLSSKKITQMVFVIFLIAIASISISAQSKKKKSAVHPEPKKPVIISENGIPNSTDSNKSTASTKSSNIYVQSLRDQLAIREREFQVAKDSLEKTKQLFSDGILSKRDVEKAEVALVEAQTKADDIRRKLAVYEGTSIEAKDTTAEVENKTEDETKTDEVVAIPETESNVKRTTQTRAKTPVKKSSSVKKTKRP